MENNQQEQWLIVDDSATDRRRMLSALTALYPDVKLITASTVAEAQDILSRRVVDLCLLDFFLRGTTTERLIRSLRSQSPEVPIVVVSGQAGSQKRIYNAGADAIVPKIIDSESFHLVIKSATLHAREIRRIKASKIQLRRIYMTAELTAQFHKIIDGSESHILITSPEGMGRTDVARSLAERLQNNTVGLTTCEVMTVKCSDPETILNFEDLFFGKGKGAQYAHKGLLEIQQDRILIIDDVHCLPEQLLQSLRDFLAKKTGLKSISTHLPEPRLRVIFTAKSEQQTQNVVEQSLGRVISHRIKLPEFESLFPELKKVLAFFIQRASDQMRCKMKADRGFLRVLTKAIETQTIGVTLRSIARTIEDAMSKALEDGRSILLESDLGNLEYLIEALPNQRTINQLTFALYAGDVVGVKAWQKLYEAAREKSFDEATKILRIIMVEYAMCKHRGNKTKVAAQLNVARQHLYKPCLKNIVDGPFQEA